MFDVLEPKGLDGARWLSYYNRLPVDRRAIHFSPQYARTQISLGEASVFCAVYEADEHFVMQPFQLRPIAGVNDGSDIASLYGYGGPVSTLGGVLGAMQWELFDEQFRAWLRSADVVSEWAMLHPMMHLHQRELLRAGQVNEVKNTVQMRAGWEHRDGMRATRLHCITKARGVVLVDSVEANRATIASFVSLYRRTMDRVSAPDRFRFPARYFGAHFSEMPDNAILLQAQHEGVLVSSALLIVGGKWAQYQFAGNDLVDGASDLMVMEAARIAGLCGADWLDLGGGRTSKPDDSLYLYKSSFSKTRAPACTYSRIFDAEKYASICAALGVGASAPHFPAYRSEVA